MTSPLPIPADYAAVRPAMTARAAREHFGVSNKSICRWDEIIGHQRSRVTTWTPERNAKLRQLLSEGLDYQEAADKLGVTVQSVTNRCHRIGLRMRKDVANAKRAESRAMMSGRSKVNRNRAALKGQQFGDALPGDRASCAARHLQRFYVGVYHRGREDKAQLGIWQVGHKRMTEAEMIELARARDFEATPAFRIAA